MYPEKRFLELTAEKVQQRIVSHCVWTRQGVFLLFERISSSEILWKRPLQTFFLNRPGLESSQYGQDLEDDAQEEKDRRRANEHYRGGRQIARQIATFADVGEDSCRSLARHKHQPRRVWKEARAFQEGLVQEK